MTGFTPPTGHDHLPVSPRPTIDADQGRELARDVDVTPPAADPKVAEAIALLSAGQGVPRHLRP